MAGWIKIHRQIKEHWIWQDPVKLKWWLDMIMEVNHSPSKVNIGNQLFEVNKGQSVKSLQTWAIYFKTSKDSVRNFFKLLEKDGMIKTENLHKTTRITICKYDVYQTDLHDKPTQTKRKPNDSQTQTHPNKNDEEEIKNEKEYYRIINHLKLSFDELDKLLIDYEQKDIDSVLDAIENYKKNKNYSSLYLTAKNWLGRDFNKKSEKPKIFMPAR